MYTVDVTPYLNLPDSTLLREVDGRRHEVMTLIEFVMVSMWDNWFYDFQEVRKCILEQIAEGYLEVVDENPTPNEFANWKAQYDEKEFDSFFRAAGMLVFSHGQQTLVRADCIEWLQSAPANSISAVITDPPYGLREYSRNEQQKMRSKEGGIWRHAPRFDGCNRTPLPRFTVLTAEDRESLLSYFRSWGRALLPVLAPGAHVFIAGTPLLSPLVAYALSEAGFERRGEIVRLVRTLRGGDRPKGAEAEFPMVSTMPRACWEPWGLYRKPLGTRTVAENLRKYGVGGLRRQSAETPFLDVIDSGVAPEAERAIASHPSLKPQAFLRQIVEAALPTREGCIIDPFAGSGSTLAACESKSVRAIGTEIDPEYFALATRAIPALAEETRMALAGSEDRQQLTFL